MTKVRPVYLDSNFCRFPHILKQYGPYESIALDLLVFIAGKTHRPTYKTNPINLQVHQRVYFHAQDFCKEFNHARQIATTKLTDKDREQLKDYSPTTKAEIVSQLDYVLFMMMSRNATFDRTKRYQVAGPDGKVMVEWEALQVFGRLITNRTEEHRKDTEAIRYSMDVLAGFIGNNHHRGQRFFLEDYLRLVTEGGKADTERKPTKSGQPRQVGRPRAWVAGRRLFLRLIWKWGMWQEENRKLLDTLEDDFEELCEVANLMGGTDRLRATRLRDYLDRVCQLGDLPFTAEVRKVRPNFAARQATGKLPPPYQVVLTKRKALQLPGQQQQLAL